MAPEQYQRYCSRLQDSLQREPAVLGVVALGSMSGLGRAPDAWSDHDFFVVVAPGQQERFRTRLDWLPEAAQVVFGFRETAHGLKAFYGDGHLVEFAVFDPEELGLARVNRYAVLFDRVDIGQRLAAVRARTAEESNRSRADSARLMGHFLGAVWTGAARYHRGEHLSARSQLQDGVRPLAALIAAHVPPADAAERDDLDALRRFELAYPKLGPRIAEALSHAVPAAAPALLELTDTVLAPGWPDYPAAAVTAVQGALARWQLPDPLISTHGASP